jgi:hypothetical protein
MMRRAMAAALAGLVLASGAWAQAPGRWRWQPGQVLVYQVEQVSRATETVDGTKVEVKTRHRVTKRWQVLGVDASGTATLQLSHQALSYEATRPDGEVLRYDSADADKCTPQLREQFSQYVGRPLAVLRVDPQGRVLEVKESKFGAASKFENELPFVGVLPAEGPRPGQVWQRAYQVTLEPPQGTGEKFPAEQHYTCKAVTGNLATVALSTELKGQPAALADCVPLLQLQPEGEFVFDLQAGRMQSANVRIEKELKEHQGPGSSYRFESTYTEQYVGDR